MSHEHLKTDLIDLFTVAIVDSLDMDWNAKDGARYCADALFAEPELIAAIAKAVQP
jgi:hypothetical protein